VPEWDWLRREGSATAGDRALVPDSRFESRDSEDPAEGNSTGMSASSSLYPVRSITLSSILSFAAFSASRWAVAPEPHAFSSLILLSAACQILVIDDI
jgi:hypothetical protein